MEEVSSLDSFHTEGAESSAMPESSTTMQEEQGVTQGAETDGDITTLMATQSDTNQMEGETTTVSDTNDEHFEQISDEAYALDDNSQATSAEQECKTPIEAKITESTDSGEHQKATDFEEVDANVSAVSNVVEESNMLGDSDMTVPMHSALRETEESGTEYTMMEVDHEDGDGHGHGEGDTQHEEEGASNDVEMASPDNAQPADTQIEQRQGRPKDGSKEQRDSSHVSGNLTQELSAATEQREDSGHYDVTDMGGKSKASTTAAHQHSDDANESEPCEHVQEPEESDVCLIPDDTESQMTEEEKEQALLARENAEKDDSESQIKEEDIGNEHESAHEEVNPGESSTHQSGNASNSESAEVDERRTPHDEAHEHEHEHEHGDRTVVVSKVIISWILSSIHKCKQCDREKSCEFRFKDPKSMQAAYLCNQACCEAIQAAYPGKYFIRRKKLLVEELSAAKRSTRAVMADESSAERAAAVAATIDKGQANANNRDTNDSHDNDNGNGNGNDDDDLRRLCVQCKAMSECRYFFKQDNDVFYLCGERCFDELSAAQPHKFKLKRHSIRVRNMGAAASSTSRSADEAEADAEPEVGSEMQKATTQETDESTTIVVPRTAAEAEAARLERAVSFTRRCAVCTTEIVMGERNLSWETMDFCDDSCLLKYLQNIGAACQTCKGEVPYPALGKYCVRFGFHIRQFCCASCLNEFKKGLKICSCCQKDISGPNEGFLAPVGDKEQFKDFCSQNCMRRYDCMCNAKKKLRTHVCAVCNNEKPVRVEIVVDGKECNFCSNPCFSAFKFVSNIIADQCAMCCKYFERKGKQSFTIYTDRRAKMFCSRICLNVYINANRHIVACQWCKVKKYNFDMICKQCDAQEIVICSLNCLTLYGVSLKAFTRAEAKCDNCKKSTTPQYHLTMSDASMRNFCTYQCVMQFQSQFARAPLTLESDTHLPLPSPSAEAGKRNDECTPFPTGLPKRIRPKDPQQQNSQLKNAKSTPKSTSNASANKKNTLPVISTVSSLASGETETMIGNVTVRRKAGRGRRTDTPPPQAGTPEKMRGFSSSPPATANAASSTNTATSITTSVSNVNAASAAAGGRGRGRRPLEHHNRSPSPASPSQPLSSSKLHAPSEGGTPPHTLTTASTSTSSATGQCETKVITVPPYPPAVRNVMTSCRPQACSVGVQSRPTMESIGIQTDKDYSNKVLIPVPVPIFVPQPMYMYSAPFPVPVPIPLPIPVPIFIPTTRNSAQGILKEIKKIQDKMPADPFEAELLMMAEMVAEEKRDSDSDSDEEIKPEPGTVTIEYGNNVQQVEVANNSYGEDVLQMALKMATGEYDQPTVDLETAMTVNTISNPPPGMIVTDESLVHMGLPAPAQQQVIDNQRKRTAALSPRQHRSPVKRARLQEMEPAPQQVIQPIQTLEKPDANMCLKYTFGVNAWKQWVMTKNTDIEKSSIKRRPFKTELLQMTADELNYSLCLFVKEVRKPNGTEYAPDTIYYLVLGIQQYLYENGRIDNIFTDPYYERFTDCLDEVARKFSVLYNDSQYIVTRVEEEHLWECKQLGAHSPHVLLSTLMFFNTKHFNLTTVEEHMQLSFSHIMKHWKRSGQNAKTPGTRNVLLRFYPPQSGIDSNPRKKKVYEQQENEENPLRCPVRLYEFYLSKCPESVKTRNDVFYLQPERSCVPDSPVWYSTQALSQESLQKMLHRVKMVKEINIALLTS